MSHYTRRRDIANPITRDFFPTEKAVIRVAYAFAYSVIMPPQR